MEPLPKDMALLMLSCHKQLLNTIYSSLIHFTLINISAATQINKRILFTITEERQDHLDYLITVLVAVYPVFRVWGSHSTLLVLNCRLSVSSTLQT